MRVIHKFELQTVPMQEILMPAGARHLMLSVQNGKPMIWALVDPEATMIQCRFRTFSDGEAFDEKSFQSDYIGSYILDGSSLVGHVVQLVNA